METEKKLEALAAAARFDVCGWSGRAAELSPTRFIYRATTSGGKSVCLFKVLLTNVCVNDCAYCANQCRRDVPRYSFQPDELAKTFMELRRKRLVRGLFLSSGIGTNAAATMEAMVKTVTILRERYDFRDYIHLKILPGTPFDCVEEACKLATRVSINVEAPTPAHLARLSSKKDLSQGIIERMRWVKQLMGNNESLVPSGQTTQFVVGAAGESDRDILHTTEALCHEIGLRRVYYSAFHPISRSRLEGVPPVNPKREHRLYQTEWLIRVYGFSHQEIELALDKAGGLLLSRDPKSTIAEKQPWLFPVDLNTASREELLRVPGVGPVSAARIVAARADHSIYSLEQLRKMGVRTRRATPFVWFQGMLPWERQASFLPELDTVEAAAPSLEEVLT